tara:strand:- start:712 stop:831 length:120 start_codon:yes stop_codon:yes gene_type:complete
MKEKTKRRFFKEDKIASKENPGQILHEKSGRFLPDEKIF